jgi:hypothetical protein
MDKLSNRVIGFARRKAPNSLRAPSGIRSRRAAGALICQWKRDPATGRLHCAWSLRMAEGHFDASPRLRLAG